MPDSEKEARPRTEVVSRAENVSRDAMRKEMSEAFASPLLETALGLVGIRTSKVGQSGHVTTLN